MPKGYWIVRADITDPEAYKKYVAANAEPLPAHGARFLVRGGPAETSRGRRARPQRRGRVPQRRSGARLLRRRRLPARDRPSRDGAATFDFIIIEGYDGPQPGD